jgi:hypothetical protein
MIKLDNLKWVPRWVSHLGCIKGCLNFLDLLITDAWLYVATGHAFILNVTPDLCPSGPTDWNTEKIIKLGENIGYKTETISGWKGNENLNQLQERAWEHVKTALDNKIPCYGWELDIPEFYVIFGYDNKGYYISGPECDEDKEPIPWRNLGTSEIGVVEVHSNKLKKAAKDEKVIFDSLSYALEYAYKPDPWTDPRSSGGLKAYDTWIDSLKNGIAYEFVLAYNSIVWLECRKNAVEFLQEANDRLNDRDIENLFNTSINYYNDVSQKLELVSNLYPFSQNLEMRPIQIDSRSLQAAEALHSAKDSEIVGLEILAKLIDKMR